MTDQEHAGTENKISVKKEAGEFAVGQTAETAGKALSGAGKGIDKGGKAATKGGVGMMKAGARVSALGFGVGAIAGVPMAAVGAGVAAGGLTTRAVAKGAKLAGKGGERAGRIEKRKAAQGLKRKGVNRALSLSQKKGGKSKISNITAVFMIVVAIFFDVLIFAINLIPLLGQVLSIFVAVIAYLTFFVWFWFRGLKLMSKKKVATFATTGAISLVPILNMLPAILMMVVATISFERKLPVLSWIGGKKT